MKRVLLAAVLLLMCASVSAAGKKRVACVGDSVTFGMRVEDREHNCYPAQLQLLLGDDYDVRNFGYSGSTLLTNGHTPYVKLEEYKAAIDFAADIAIIHLGLNDTDPRDLPEYGDEFVSDYMALIESFRKANPSCRVLICRMTPIFHTHRRFNTGTRELYRQEQLLIESIAEMAGTQLIDLQSVLYSRPDLMPDALHPNAAGARLIAERVYSALTGDYGGLKMPAVYSDNMVLQCGRPLTIAGTADAGDKVTVKAAKQKLTATADCNGRWEVTLQPLEASFKPFAMEVSTRDRKLRFENLLAGEVWLCSGQSNMAFRLNESEKSEYEEQLAYAGGNSAIRLFDMKPAYFTDNIKWSADALREINELKHYRPASWQECSRETADIFSAVGFAFGRMLADSLHRPIGLICNAVGGSTTESWTGRSVLEAEYPEIMYNLDSNPLIQTWVRERRAFNVSESPAPQLQRHPYDPCYLFETGIEPLRDFAIKGVIWYQGESNAHYTEAHERLFRLMVKSWRENRNDPEMPFHIVQLSSIERPSWPRFRDSQRRLVESIDNCDMAVCSDLGSRYNVHPVRKKAVGERLARLALKNDYGFDITAAGPAPLLAKNSGRSTTVTFGSAEGLSTSDGEAPRTFEVAEYDGMYYPAEAVIENGTVVLHCDKVARPRFVRYGWQPYTTANLINGEALPASTFKIEITE